MGEDIPELDGCCALLPVMKRLNDVLWPVVANYDIMKLMRG